MPSLLDWLVARYPTAKRQTFKGMLADGRLTINGKRPRSLRASVADGDRVVVSDRSEKPVRVRAPSMPFAIVYEDADVLVIDKPAGLLTSTNERERRPTAWAAVQNYLAITDPASRPGLIHRLDRDASGLLVFSKNDTAYRSLKQQFLHHTVSRIYIAHVHGNLNPLSGRLRSRLIEGADGIVRATRKPGAGQEAITDYETVSTNGARSILRLTLHTGRKHQIRTQLAQQQTPIVNDRFYGTKACDGPLMLRATQLEFDHPRTGKSVKFEAASHPRL